MQRQPFTLSFSGEERAHHPVVVSISGRTRAGKTTLARNLAGTLGWPSASFSSYVRAEARARHLPEQRRMLQDLGAQLIDELGWDDFCRAMLAQAGLGSSDAPFIVEGARHQGTLFGLANVVAPVPVRSVYLDVSDAERNRRLAQEGIDATTGAEWEQHSTEREVLEILPDVVDLVVDADQPVEEVAKTVLDFLHGGEGLALRPRLG